MTDRTVAIKITSDGRAFVVDMAANQQATQQFGQSLDEAGKHAQTTATQIRQAGKDAADGFSHVAQGAAAATNASMTWTEFVKANMGPAMKQFAAEGLSHSEAHTRAIRQIAEQWKSYKASGVDANTGVLSAVKGVAPQLQQTSQNLDRLSTSAANSAHMLRMVGPQITDVVTQLAAGQSPIQVLIQQGGQLKDVFGGIGPAARAVGGYIAGMINPVTVAAGVVGLLAYAFVKGSTEADQFTRQVILTGNAAGGTISQYRAMAGELAKIGGSRSAALETIGALAQQGRVGAENLQRYAAIAQQLDRLVGKPVADTAKEFAALGEQPVEASAKLTQTYNYLTAATYSQIKALKDAGQETKAAELAQSAFADAMETRLPQMASNLGVLERAWLGIKDAIAKTAESALAIGRAPTPQEALALAQQRLAQAQGKDPNKPSLLPWEGNAQSARKEVEAAQAAVDAEKRSAFLAGERATQMQRAATWAKELAQAQSIAEQREDRIRQIQATGLALSKQQSEIDKVIAAVREKMIDPKEQDAIGARLVKLQKYNDLQAEITRSGVEQVAAAYRQGLSSEVEYIERTGALEIKQLERDRVIAQAQIQIARQKPNAQREVADLEGQVAVIEEKIAARRQKVVDDVATSQAQREKKARQFYADERAQWQAEQAEAERAADARAKAADEGVKQYTDALKLQNDAVDFEISLMGKSAEEQRQLIELRRIDIGLLQEKVKIEKQAEGGNLGAAKKQEELDKVDAAAAEAKAKAITGIWAQRWQQTNQDVSETLYDLLTARTKDAADSAAHIFENLVLRPTIMAFVQPVSGAITSAITGSPGAAIASGASSGIMGSAVGSLFGSSLMGSGLSTSLSNGLIGGFGMNMANIGNALAGGQFPLALGGALPYLGVALGAISVLSSALKGGETRVGGQYSGTSLIDHPSGGEINGDATRGAIGATIASINDTLKRLGSSATVSGFYSGLEESTAGKGFAYARGALSTGQTFGDWSRQGYMQNRGTMSAEEAAAKFGEELKRATLQALQAANVPGQLGEYLRQLGDVELLSGGALDESLARVNKALSEKAQLEDRYFELTHSQAEITARDRQRERDALDESNRALYDQITALQDQSRQAVDTGAATVSLAAALDKLRNPIRSVDDVARSLFDLERQGQSLRVQLLQGQGDNTGSRALQRSIDTAGMTEAEVALYDYNQALRDQVQALQDAASHTQAVTNERVSLEQQLLQLQGNTVELRRRELAALDPSNRALQQMVWSLQDAQAVTNERVGLEQQLLQVQGNTVELRRRELAALDPSNRALQQMVWSLQDAQDAAGRLSSGTDAAMAALQRAIDSERKAAQLKVDLAREQVSTLTSLLGYLRGQVDELYGQVAPGMLASAGREFIDSSLAAARSTGYLPDQDQLASAVSAVRQSMSSANYGSSFEARRDQLVLAGKLSQLQGVTGRQLSTAQQQLQAAEQQVQDLDNLQQEASAQIEALRGIDTRVLSVRDAIDRLAQALAREAAGTGRSPTGAATEQWVQTATGQMWQSTGGAVGVADATGFSIHTKDGLQFTGDQVRGWVNDQLAAGDPMAVYEAAVAKGISANSLDHLMGWIDGTANTWARDVGVPTFAGGGRHFGGARIVGEKGPELEVTGPSHIFNAEDTKRIFGAASDPGTAAELRQLRAENQAQARAIASLNARMVGLLERWERDGMPETRLVV